MVDIILKENINLSKPDRCIGTLFSIAVLVCFKPFIEDRSIDKSFEKLRCNQIILSCFFHI